MATANCTIIGQSHRSNAYSTGAAYVGYGSSKYYDYHLKFTTPDFSGVSSSITFNLRIYNTSYTTAAEFRYAICTSDANVSLYQNHENEVNNDEYQITSGTVTITDISQKTVKSFTVDVGGLNPSTTYYLFMWAYANPYLTFANVSEIADHSIDLSYESGLVYIYGCSTSYETNDGTCAIVGQSHRDGDYQTGAAYVGYDDVKYYDYHLKFTTPSFSGVSDSITFNIKMYNTNYTTAEFRYAICTSDANRSLYQDHRNAVDNDEYQIASGFISIQDINQKTVKSFTIDNIGSLYPSTTYYLFLWTYAAPYPTFANIDETSDHSISIAYNVSADGSVESFGYEPYVVYIDNGTSWDMYIPYIDNGTSWDICV